MFGWIRYLGTLLGFQNCELLDFILCDLLSSIIVISKALVIT